jgi:hypothetical protein
MKVLKTINGKTINVTVNQSAKTFTIRTNSGKYRTLKMNKTEFLEAEENTGNDWQNFLNSSQNYYLVK